MILIRSADKLDLSGKNGFGGVLDHNKTYICIINHLSIEQSTFYIWLQKWLYDFYQKNKWLFPKDNF